MNIICPGCIYIICGKRFIPEIPITRSGVITHPRSTIICVHGTRRSRNLLFCSMYKIYYSLGIGCGISYSKNTRNHKRDILINVSKVSIHRS